MKTITLHNGMTCHISDLSQKAAMNALKEEFRKLPFTEAIALVREDIDYMVSKGYAKRCNIIRALRGTSEFAGLYNA